MRLYYHPMSSCSRRVLMAVNQLKMDIELIQVDLFKGKQRSPEFLTLNANGKVPVLEHDGFVLWESYAIMQYLADRVPNQTLYPTEPRARADVNRWLYWCGQSFMPGISTLNWENHIKPMAGLGLADPQEVARGERQLTEAAAILDQHLNNREWVCNSGLSLADLALAAPLDNQHKASFPIADYSNLQQWLKRIKALDAWKHTES